MTTILNFDSSPSEPVWYAVNDGVMGGVSEGGAEIRDGLLHFTGTLSLENNGGFSSVRTREGSWDFSDATEVHLRVKGDGRTYQLRLNTRAEFRNDPISYGAEFATKSGEWMEVVIPLAALSPSYRGRTLDGPPFDPTDVQEIGILIGDKTPGPFKLQVDWIKIQ